MTLEMLLGFERFPVNKKLRKLRHTRISSRLLYLLLSSVSISSAFKKIDVVIIGHLYRDLSYQSEHLRWTVNGNTNLIFLNGKVVRNSR